MSPSQTLTIAFFSLNTHLMYDFLRWKLTTLCLFVSLHLFVKIYTPLDSIFKNGFQSLKPASNLPTAPSLLSYRASSRYSAGWLSSDAKAPQLPPVRFKFRTWRGRCLSDAKLSFWAALSQTITDRKEPPSFKSLLKARRFERALNISQFYLLFIPFRV